MKFTFFTVFKFIHVAFVIAGMGTAIFLHSQFLRKKLTWGQFRHFFLSGSKIIWIGLAGAIITGIIMWLKIGPGRPPLFYGKVGLVAMLLVDGILIAKIGKPRLHLLKPDQGFYDLAKEHRRAFYISGAISVVGWWGALFIAYMT